MKSSTAFAGIGGRAEGSTSGATWGTGSGAGIEGTLVGNEARAGDTGRVGPSPQRRYVQ